MPRKPCGVDEAALLLDQGEDRSQAVDVDCGGHDDRLCGTADIVVTAGMVPLLSQRKPVYLLAMINTFLKSTCCVTDATIG